MGAAEVCGRLSLRVPVRADECTTAANVALTCDAYGPHSFTYLDSIVRHGAQHWCMYHAGNFRWLWGPYYDCNALSTSRSAAGLAGCMFIHDACVAIST